MAKEKVTYTQPRTQEDLEARLGDDHIPASAVNEGVVLVNPNPFGDEAYAGTDPIYQNYANDTEKPLRSGKGAEKKAEDLVRKNHEFGDDDEVVDDSGTGGKASRTRVQSPVQSMNAADYETSQSDSTDEDDDKDKDDGDGGSTPASPPVPPTPDGQQS